MSSLVTVYNDITKYAMVDRIAELEQEEGKLNKLLRNDQYASEYKSDYIKVPVRTKGQWMGGHKDIEEPLGKAGTTAFVSAKYIPSFYYNWAEFPNLAKLLSSNPQYSIVNIASDIIDNMLQNTNRELNWLMWGNYGDMAYITSTASDAFSSPTMTLKVGGNIADSVHTHGATYLQEGMFVDLIDATDLLPLSANTNNMEVTSVGFSATNGAVLITVKPSGGTTMVSDGHTAGDFFVKHGEIEADGTPKGLLGMTGIFASGNPNGAISMANWHIGALNASSYTWWNPAYNGDAGGSATTTRSCMNTAIYAANKWNPSAGGGEMVMMGNILTGQVIAAAQENSKVTYNFINTSERWGGFTKVKWNFGDYGSYILWDTDAPPGRIYFFNPKSIHYCVIEDLTIQEPGIQSMINHGIDKSRMTVRKVHAVLLTTIRRPMALIYDIA